MIIKPSGNEEQEEKDLAQVFLLKLPNSHLRSIGDIGLCSNLTICILSNNFISRFDSLVGCMSLMKLDLHSNQVSITGVHNENHQTLFFMQLLRSAEGQAVLIFFCRLARCRVPHSGLPCSFLNFCICMTIPLVI